MLIKIDLPDGALPRWNGLPIVTGSWVPLVVIASLIVQQINGMWIDLPDAIFLILWLINLAGLAGLGYLVQSDSRPIGATAASV